MKSFQELVKETLAIRDLEELEAAADLFQFGIEKGYYNKRQCDEFNNTYWKVKNKCLGYSVADVVKGNPLDIISIVTSAPNEIKDNNAELISYVNSRLKALKGKVTGLR
ncbi:hypothetical protein SAMN02745134_03839 [Clostridium acidisoli DSM 12555]|jgi:hypothetical protein|uniref:Uncharacterized protein n=1 Tax=Clostridium acidisoli DSM 12555 TaxID=1121291 RepID=A0A1W1XZA2_9CLOT|nr:hypothetical protein [Clostridium acidisoli]SMC29299.1 hypothetical protein SAMN02745134_03839 [Clostridium acidisoli DSM 12555]